jgi:DNA repair exonuclease SbcCD nuclease subunit
VPDSSDPLVILHTADLHFGRRYLRTTRDGDNVRELDIYKAGDVVSSWIAETLKPDLAVIAGDVWDDSRPSPQALRHGYDFPRKLREADIPVVVVGGNHDTVTTPGRPTPLEHLARYFGCHVALEQSSIEVAGIQICAVPYRTLSSGDFQTPDYSSEVPNLLVVHADADGDDLPDFAQYSYVRLPRAALFDQRSALRLLGHVHVHQSIGERAYYSGALERLTFGEIRNDPSVYVHRLFPDGRVETESVRVADMGEPNVPRPALDLTLDCSEMEAGNVVDAAHAHLEAHPLDEALVQLTLAGAPREIYSVHYEEALNKRASKRGAFALKVRVRLREDELADNAAGDELPDMEHVPGAALSEAYKVFASAKGDSDLSELGCQLIAQASGELAEGEPA